MVLVDIPMRKSRGIGAIYKTNFMLTLQLHAQMQRHPEVNWSAVARRAIAEVLDLLESADPVVSVRLQGPAVRVTCNCQSH